MKNKGFAVQWIILMIIAILLIGIGVYFIFFRPSDNKQQENKPTPIENNTPSPSGETTIPTETTAKDITYTIDNEPVKFVEGKSGNFEVGISTQGDFNSDNGIDTASILIDSQNNTKSYYISVALKDGDNLKGTNAVLLPSDLEPKDVSVIDNVIIVSYAKRSDSDPTYNRLAKVKSFGYIIVDGVLKEVPPAVVAEKGCVASGGKVVTRFCCSSSNEFPNLCAVGACGCSPTNRKEIKICDCGTNKCFNGNGCVVK
ncbi:MAG: hypothetical protein PHR47_02235 [Candidatus Pacebacteria bacterium]|nr:hypothetical protein [Candidatus Paceibacterota bacterium]